jgi:hypothetical protein
MANKDPAATAVERMQDRLPASLYEVAWQYSQFDWLDAAESEAIDWELAPEHLASLTPRAKGELFGANDSLIVVYADLSDLNTPSLRDEADGGPVEIATYTEQDRFRIGHSYPEGKSGKLTDYSITTHKSADAGVIAGLRTDRNGNPKTNTVQDRFTKWAQSEFAESVREKATDDDAAVLYALAALGNDEAAMGDLADAFLDRVGSENEELDALITVRVRLPNTDDYKFPGEIGVLNEVMRAKKAARLENISVDDASGDGTGYITGTDGTVTGGSPGLFGMYGKKQREHFPDLDTTGASAWRNRPLDFDVAEAVASAGSLFDDFYRGLGNSRRLYVLPYLAARKHDLDPATFRWFHRRVYRLLRDAETGSDGEFDDELETVMRRAARLTDAVAEGADTDDALFGEAGAADWDVVRFAVVHQVTGEPDRVFFDTLDGLAPATALNDAHNSVTRTSPFRNDGIFTTPVPESSPLLGRTLRLTRYIMYGGYFRRTTEPTRNSREASETPGAGAIDDSRMQRVRNLLTSTRIDATALLEQYIGRVAKRSRLR